MKRFAILFISMLALNTLFSSFAFAHDDNDSKPSLVALGDSITLGSGLKPGQAFPYLIGKHNEYDVNNLGYPGATSSDLLYSVTHPDHEYENALEHADIITLDIGSDDLVKATGITSLETKTLTLQEQAAMIASLKNAENKLKHNLPKIIKEIREQNVCAPIILFNLYNPFGPSKDPFYQTLHKLGDEIISGVNEEAIAPLNGHSDTYLADAFSAFDGNQSKLIIPGDIHPNEKGQRVLSNLADKVIASVDHEDEKLTVQLSATPAEPTKDPITITVKTNAENVASMKWLPGEKTAEDFSNAGNEIGNSSFQVSENGKYSVYVKSNYKCACSQEQVATIDIENIIKDVPVQNDPTPTPEPAPTPTQAPTVQAPAPSASALPIIPISTSTSGTSYSLPNTATQMYNFVTVGLIILLAGFTLLIINKKSQGSKNI
jgi:LPXTG-motif cell wall-anchored protein